LITDANLKNMLAICKNLKILYIVVLDNLASKNSSLLRCYAVLTGIYLSTLLLIAMSLYLASLIQSNVFATI